jgi:hypothetical protein
MARLVAIFLLIAMCESFYFFAFLAGSFAAAFFAGFASAF